MNISSLYSLYQQYPSVQTDTRKLKKGDIYFALKGPHFNGNAFAMLALDAGASYAVIDDAKYATDGRCILTPNVLDTLQQLALYHRKQLSVPFIAITGSNGKTTTKELVTAVLLERFITYSTEGNLNNHIGVPLTILKIKKDAGIAVIEMGANHQKEIESYCNIALPTHGLITNIGKAHIEGFGGIEGVQKGKGELYDFLRANNGTIFRNTDQDVLEIMATGIDHQVTYGSANAQVIGRPVMNGVFLQVAVLTKGYETIIPTNLVGAYNFPNIMAAIAVGIHFGLTIDEIKKAIATYNPDNSRSQWLQRGSNKIILDAYNANPSSMRAAIANFATAPLPHKTLWIGGMKEMGAEEKAEHTLLVSFINQYEWENVVLVGKEFEGLQGQYNWFENSAEAAAYIKTNPPSGHCILIKGSRGSKMEIMLDALPNT